MEKYSGHLLEAGVMVRNYNFLRIAPSKLGSLKTPIRPEMLTCGRIVELLMQLFWKQNRYAFNNSHHSHKDKVPELRNQSKEATPTQQSDLEGSIDPALTSSAWDVSGPFKAQHIFPGSKSPRETFKQARTYCVLEDDDDDTIIAQPPAPAGSSMAPMIDTSSRDIFEVPDDPVSIHRYTLKSGFRANLTTVSTHVPPPTKTSPSCS